MFFCEDFVWKKMIKNNYKMNSYKSILLTEFALSKFQSLNFAKVMVYV